MKNKIFLFTYLLLWVGLFNLSSAQEAKSVSKGYVYHQDGTPFQNVSINIIKGSISIQATTDNNGYYEVQQPENCKVEISFPQHFTKTVFPVDGKEMKTYLVKNDRFSLERTYHEAASINKLRSNNGSVSLIVPHDNYTENETVDDLWRGISTGVYSSKQSGMPGSGSLNILRGIHSLHTYKSPIVIIDGMYIGDYNFEDPAINGNTQFQLLGINPAIIQEIVFLKDGASTLRYGVKGGNGVILINTKRADIEKTRIFADFSSGISTFEGEIPMMNVAQHRKYLQSQMFNSGLTYDQIPPALGPDAKSGDYPRWDQNTNWQKELFKPALRTNMNFSFSGGDEISKFYFSLGYTGNGGTIENTKMDRLNAQLNADVAVSSKLNLKANLGFGYTTNQLFDHGTNYAFNPIYASLIKSPMFGVLEAVGGGLYQQTFDTEDEFNYSNPAAIIANSEELRTSYSLIGSFRFNYQFNKSLYANLMIGNSLNQLDDDVFIPDFGIGRLPGSEAKQTLRRRDDKSISWYSNFETGYNNTWNNNSTLSARLGANLNVNSYTSGLATALNTGSDDFKSIQFGDVTTRQKDGAWIKDNWLNTYLLLDYDYKHKYFFSTGISMDGSSRFGSDIKGNGVKLGDNTYSLLYSFSLGWDIAGEPGFMNDIFEVFKLRTGLSLRGNDLFNNFVAKSYYVPVQYYDITGLAKGGVMNSGISWESSQNIEVGLDVALKKENANFSLNYFNENVEDVISQSQLNGYYGFSTLLENTAQIKMEGFEASVRATVIESKIFSWDAGINITKSKSRIVELANDELIKIPGAEKINRQGEAPFSFYGWKFLKVLSTDAEAFGNNLTDEFGNVFEAGDAKFEDINHDGMISKEDKQILGNPFPDYWGSITNKFRLGNFGLYFRTSFSVGAEVFNYTRSKLESGDSFFNQTTSILNAWGENGSITDVPRIQYGDPIGNSRFSSRWIEDASNIRLDEVTLTYNFKLKNEFINGLQIYVSGKNLLVLTDYLGYDPEFAYGLDVNTMGVDYFSAPLNTSYLVGVKVDF